MITYEDVYQFLGKKINVGVAHRVVPGKIFWYFGILIEVNDLYLKLEIKDGVKVVPLTQVLQVQIRDWRPPQ